MHDNLADLRFRQLMDSPGGRALLIVMAHSGITPAQAVEPETALHLIPDAVGELNPWHAWHDEMVQRIRDEGQRHTDLARALIDEPGIERWWAPLDRDRQGWVEPEKRYDFPTPGTFPTLHSPPTRLEHYAQWPEHHISTSTIAGDWTYQLASIGTSASDWHMDYPARRKRVRVSPDARIREITSADDWHAMVTRHGAQTTPEMSPHPGSHDVPWGTNDGLVPDWRSIAGEWDGVHITLWAFLTGTQVRVTSRVGWTEMWSRESEETTWLRWVFDDVEETPPVDLDQVRPHFSLPFHMYAPPDLDTDRPQTTWITLKPGQDPG